MNHKKQIEIAPLWDFGYIDTAVSSFATEATISSSTVSMYFNVACIHRALLTEKRS